MKLTEDRNLYKGIFWIVDLENIHRNRDYCFQIQTDRDGYVVDDFFYNSKNGETLNHKATWEELPRRSRMGVPFNYFPRGRVEINHGKAVIYANPNICTQEVKDFIVDEFNLTQSNGINEVVMKADGSPHYMCYLD